MLKVEEVQAVLKKMILEVEGDRKLVVPMIEEAQFVEVEEDRKLV